MASPSGRVSAPWPTMTSGRFASARALAKSPSPAASCASDLRPGAEIVDRIGQVDLLADQADPHAALAPAAPNARVEHRRLAARIRADEQDDVGVVDAGDGRVEDVARPAALRVELGAVLAAIEMRRAEGLHQRLQREHLLDARQGRRRWPRSASPNSPRSFAAIAAKASLHVAGSSRAPRRR